MPNTATPIYDSLARTRRRKNRLLRLLGLGSGLDRWERVNTYSDGYAWTPGGES